MIIDYTFLFIGIVYATILPGFVVVESFWPKWEFWKKLPFYLIFSIAISTITSYLFAMIFGFNKVTLTTGFILFLLALFYLIVKKKINFNFKKENWPEVSCAIFIYLIYFIALVPAIFSFYNSYFVMGGPNWQDTAMHMSIIESLSQGNFPPQAPYYSGQNLTYYYFSDLHAAIINTFFGHFFPWVLTIINPYLAATFFLSVFALSFYVSKNRILSVISGITAVFYGNFGFVNLFRELFTSGKKYLSIVTDNPFNFDQKLFQIPPMSDYFLQNRPMMYGLPIFTTVVLLILSDQILIAGLLTATLIKFQLFAFVCSYIFFGIFLIATKFRDFIKRLSLFSIPSLVFGAISFGSNTSAGSFIKIFVDNFNFRPWQDHTIIWFVLFLVANLGIGFVVFLIGIFLNKNWKNPTLVVFYIFTVTIVLIPIGVCFTIYKPDMFKFFYFTVPIICSSVTEILSNSKKNSSSILKYTLILIFTSITSVNLLFHSFLNKNMGYSLDDYKAGIWIRNNTPQKSIFVTMPTVHSAPTDIGGRLRIISYINWPYSHGFVYGSDNVFVRVADVENVYKNGDTKQVKIKYNAGYVYVGIEELSDYPDALKIFDKNTNLKKVYSQGSVVVYKII